MPRRSIGIESHRGVDNLETVLRLDSAYVFFYAVFGVYVAYPLVFWPRQGCIIAFT